MRRIGQYGPESATSASSLAKCRSNLVRDRPDLPKHPSTFCPESAIVSLNRPNMVPSRPKSARNRPRSAWEGLALARFRPNLSRNRPKLARKRETPDFDQIWPDFGKLQATWGGVYDDFLERLLSKVVYMRQDEGTPPHPTQRSNVADILAGGHPPPHAILRSCCSSAWLGTCTASYSSRLQS